MTHQKTFLNSSDWTEKELLSRMIGHDNLAWKEFHRRYDRLVYHCIQKVTRHFKQVMMDEDVQDIFSSFLLNITSDNMKKLRKFNPERGNKLSTWIGILANHSAWDYLRSVSKHRKTTLMSDLPPLSSDDNSPQQECSNKEYLGYVKKILSSFSDKDQRLVHLHFVCGMAPEQIANEMNISIKTVYSKKHKIRARIREEAHAKFGAIAFA